MAAISGNSQQQGMLVTTSTNSFSWWLESLDRLDRNSWARRAVWANKDWPCNSNTSKAIFKATTQIAADHDGHVAGEPAKPNENKTQNIELAGISAVRSRANELGFVESRRIRT